MKFDKRKYSIVTEYGYLLLINEKGEVIPAQLSATVDSCAGEPQKATIALEVNLVSNIEEAIKLYNE